MRTVIVVLALFAGACTTATSDAGRRSIEVFHSPTRTFTIEDGGQARLEDSLGVHPVYEFEASREDFRKIAGLLEPLKADGLPCRAPSEHIAPGYIVWREGGEEVRRVETHIVCYGEGARPLAHNESEAWRMMEEMGHARYVMPAIPAPTSIAFVNMYWGQTTSTWTASSAGEGRYEDRHRSVAFAMPEGTFDRIRELMRPYESQDFHCNRVLTDGPYGFVVWSSGEGQEDQRTQWDGGCLTGDAGDLFGRIDEATAILMPLRDAAQPQ